MLDKQSLLKSALQPEEKLLLAKVLDQADFSLRKREVTFTDFLDAGKSGRFLEKMNQIPDLQCIAFGGYEDCERRMLGFAPKNRELRNENFPIRLLRVTKHKKFGQTNLTHRDYLGSLLGLGIDRRKIGDILVSEEETICFVQEEILDYICANWNQVSRTSVKVEQTQTGQCKLLAKEPVFKNVTVSSLRLDVVTGTVFHLSRAKVQDLIHAEKINVNWNIAQSASKPLKESDLVSVRGYGRFRLEEVKGKTKKDKLSIVIREYV